MRIRPEQPSDASAIRSVITAAFAAAPHSSGTEAAIVDALREAAALTVSLVAEDERAIVGHVAFSPVSISDGSNGWYGLGPVAVLPERQRRGIGDALIRAGLDEVRQSGARGCVIVGEPDYYRRFGFESDPALRYEGVPPPYFQRLAFEQTIAAGTVTYHPAFAS